MPGLAGYGIVAAAAALVTFVCTPLVWWSATKLGRLTPPGDRRVHERPTASLGGVAMYLGLLAGLGVAWQMDRFAPVFRGSYEPAGVLGAATIVFFVGLIDEWRKARPLSSGLQGGISAPAKLAGIVLAGVSLVLGGVTMWHFRIPFGSVLLLAGDLRPLVTVVWLAMMANAVNIIDGLDGLAAGIVAIASITFFLYAHELEQGKYLFGGSNIGPLIAATVAGMCVGFLPWNVHPAKIFMGDCGALLLGALMAVCTSVVGGRVDQSVIEGTDGANGQTFFFFAPLVIPLVVLGVPLFDAAFAVIRRASRRADVSVADKDHLHHRLMRLGHGHRRSVAILWVWTALLSAVVLIPTFTGTGNAIVPVLVAGMALVLYTVLHPEVRRSRRTNGDVEGGTGRDESTVY